MRRLAAALLCMAIVLSASSCTCSSAEPPMDQRWISPTKVQVTNYHPGGQAEYPLTVHNGAGQTETRRWRVTTEANETSVDFALTAPLHDARISEIAQLTSSLPTEPLTALRYDPATRVLTVGGFLPATTRDVSLAYNCDTEFHIYARSPDFVAPHFEEAPPHVSDWVLIADDSPVLEPYETREILIALAMPGNATAPGENWEFWVGVSAGAARVQAEMAVRWLVSMRS